MNLLNEYNSNQIKLLIEAGINIEDREYSAKERKDFLTIANLIFRLIANQIKYI